MFFGDIVFSKKLEKNWSLLGDYGIEFGRFLEHLGGHTTTVYAIVIAFVLITMKNTMELSSDFKSSWKNIFIIYILFITSLLNIQKQSEFLYFNF